MANIIIVVDPNIKYVVQIRLAHANIHITLRIL